MTNLNNPPLVSDEKLIRHNKHEGKKKEILPKKNVNNERTLKSIFMSSLLMKAKEISNIPSHHIATECPQFPNSIIFSINSRSVENIDCQFSRLIVC